MCLCFGLAKIGEAIHRLLLVQAFRPDRLLAAMHLFVDETLGSSFMKDIELVVSLPAIIEHEVCKNGLWSYSLGL